MRRKLQGYTKVPLVCVQFGETDTDCLSPAECWNDPPKLLLISGKDVSNFESYYPTDTSRNAILTAFGNPRYEPGAVLVDGKVIIAGNRHNDNAALKHFAGASFSYDPVSNDLVGVGTTVEARHGPAAALLNGMVVLCGGYNLVHLTACETYSGGQWSTMSATMNEARKHFTLTNLHNKVYAVGGSQGGTGYLSHVEYYDGTTWTVSEPIPVARRMHAATVFRDQLVACGGFNGAHLDICHSYNDVTGQWALMASLTTARSDHGLVAFYGKMYVVGGKIGGPSSSVEVYDPHSDQWSSISTQTIAPRTSAGLVVV